jgi:SAM-dependent methyltransferase
MARKADRCRVCNGVIGSRVYIAREMMYGSLDEFAYAECSNCGCLQIRDVPTNLAKYYPEDYYSFGGREFKRDNCLWYFLKHQRAEYCLKGKNIIGEMLVRAHGAPDYYRYFKLSDISFGSRLLDVGCGSGDLLLRLYRDGFTNLSGVDPYTKNEVHQEGITIVRKGLEELEPPYDMIMLNHSLEHIPDPFSTLSELGRLLLPGHCLVVRIPVIPSFAWEKYGVHWVQLDAPRHLFIHTVKSMSLLSERTGFRLADVVYDSTELQFWGSEQYLKDIPLRDKRSYDVNPSKSFFTKAQIDSYRREASKLNAAKQGDSACFYLLKQ